MFTSILKFLCFIPAGVIFSLLSVLLAPLLPLFASNDGWLPRWLLWFQTPDNSLDGDNGWKHEHWQWRYYLPYNVTIYVGQVGWLWRNRAYGFDKTVLGAKVHPQYTIEIIGDPKVSNRPLIEGIVKRILKNSDGSVYWQIYYVKKWSKTRCIRLNIGWKLWGNPKPNDRCQFVVSFNPFIGYSK